MVLEVDTQEECYKSEPCEIYPPPADMTLKQPPEIMAEIFGIVLGAQIVLPSTRGPSRYPWSLGHVCSRWRQVLWENDLIWSNILVDNHFFHRSTITPFIQRVHEALLYIISNTATPLTIFFECGAMNHCVDIIIAHPGRFRSIRTDNTSQETFTSLLSLPPYSFTHLERLSVRTQAINASLIPATSTLTTAPNLRKVFYDIMYEGYIPHHLLFFPFDRVTSICMQGMPVPLVAIQKILISSPCLVSCQAFRVYSGREMVLNRRTTLHHLKLLELYCSSPLDSNALFTPLTTLALEALVIRAPRHSLQPVISLIVRSNCPIKELCLGLCTGVFNTSDPFGVESLIHCLPSSLVHMDLSWLVAGSIFTKIREGMFPALRNICIPVDSEGLEAFARLINSYIGGTIPKHKCIESYRIYILSLDEDWDVRDRCMEWVEAWRRIEEFDIVLRDEENDVDLMGGDDESEEE